MSSTFTNPARAAILAAAEITGISHSRLYGTCRTPHVVATRRACFIVLRRKGLSFAEIGLEFGKDHATIIRGVHKGTASLQSSPWFSGLVAHLSATIA